MGYFAAISAVILWGLVQIPIRLARAPGHIGVMISMPAGLAGAAILLLLTGSFRLEASPRDWFYILATGVAYFPISTLLYFESVQRAGITNSSPITRLEPVLVVALSSALGMTPLSWFLVAAAVTIFVAGFCLARGAHLAEPPAGHPAMRVGMFYAFAACLVWVAGDLLFAKVSRSIPPLTALFYGLGFGMIVHAASLGAFGRLRELRHLTRRDVLCYAVQGIGSFSLGYWCLFASIQRLGVSRASVITGLWPLVGVMAGILVFRERMNGMKSLGIALFVLSAVLAGLASG